MLQSEVKLYKTTLEQNENDAKHKLAQNKAIYEPIIDEWVHQNGNIIKRNLKVRNAVETDIIVGMRNKMKTYQ